MDRLYFNLNTLIKKDKRKIPPDSPISNSPIAPVVRGRAIKTARRAFGLRGQQFPSPALKMTGFIPILVIPQMKQPSASSSTG